MKRSERQNNTIAWYITSIIALVLIQASCGGDGGNTNVNADENTNVNSALPAVEATVTYPDTTVDPETGPGGGLKVVAIVQVEGVGGNFFAQEEGGDTTITGFDGETSTDEFETEVDDQLRAERTTIGDTEVTFTHHEDNTFDYDVNRGGDSLYSGLSVSRTNNMHARHPRAVDAQDITNCSNSTISDLADDVVQSLEGTAAESSFIDCLQEQSELRQLAEILCVTEVVLIPVLAQETDNCPGIESCSQEIVESSLSTANSFAGILRDLLKDIIKQIRQDAALCPVTSGSDNENDNSSSGGGGGLIGGGDTGIFNCGTRTVATVPGPGYIEVLGEWNVTRNPEGSALDKVVFGGGACDDDEGDQYSYRTLYEVGDNGVLLQNCHLTDNLTTGEKTYECYLYQEDPPQFIVQDNCLHLQYSWADDDDDDDQVTVSEELCGEYNSALGHDGILYDEYDDDYICLDAEITTACWDCSISGNSWLDNRNLVASYTAQGSLSDVSVSMWAQSCSDEEDPSSVVVDVNQGDRLDFVYDLATEYKTTSSPEALGYTEEL